jgi:hypothetical protein
MITMRWEREQAARKEGLTEKLKNKKENNKVLKSYTQKQDREKYQERREGIRSYHENKKEEMGKEERETGTSNEDEDSTEEEENNKEDEIKKDEIMTAQETKEGERLKMKKKGVSTKGR